MNFGELTETEIYEIPEKLGNFMEHMDDIIQIAKKITECNVKHIYLVGSGSSFHAALFSSYLFNKLTNIPTFCEFAMEFQYLIEPILDKNDCVIAISQSGKTKDTIEAIKLAKNSKKCLSIAITNHPKSELAKVSDFVIPLFCGEEKSVLATKTYVNELAALAILSLETAKIRGTIQLEEYTKLIEELKTIPEVIRLNLSKMHKKIINYSNYFKFAEFCFILGSGPDYATSMEASLKLKEGSRIFGQAYSTAEFPHGPITLADERAWILALIPHEEDQRKRNLINLLQRIKERKATILGVYEAIDEQEMPDVIDFGIKVPNTTKELQPLVMIIAIQLLTLEIARIKGIDPDSPKFLTKVSGI
ncbi:MAG: SIS domain-containing protein [Candidatus Lokiarchaeota archaeon]